MTMPTDPAPLDAAVERIAAWHERLNPDEQFDPDVVLGVMHDALAVCVALETANIELARAALAEARAAEAEKQVRFLVGVINDTATLQHYGSITLEQLREALGGDGPEGGSERG